MMILHKFQKDDDDDERDDDENVTYEDVLR